jgi:hypothetical protein
MSAHKYKINAPVCVAYLPVLSTNTDMIQIDSAASESPTETVQG